MQVKYDDEITMQSKNVFTIQFEIYREYDEQADWVCGNSISVIKYQKDKEY